jgi:hypothetical protein
MVEMCALKVDDNMVRSMNLGIRIAPVGWYGCVMLTQQCLGLIFMMETFMWKTFAQKNFGFGSGRNKKFYKLIMHTFFLISRSFIV